MATQSARPVAAFRLTLHFGLALWMTFGLVVGFGFEFGDFFVHPRFARPPILFVHGALATAWVLLYCLQTGLIAARARSLHRALGMAGMALGTVMVVVSVPTALVMSRFDVDNGIAHVYSLLSVPLIDLSVFAGFFIFGMANRLRPLRHRPAMFIAMLALADVGFDRWPWPLPGLWFVLASLPVWLTCVLVMELDRRRTGRLNPVYAAGLPALIANDVIGQGLAILHPAWWEEIARTLSLLV